jgi:predicted alpha/beta hydrolase family esterase
MLIERIAIMPRWSGHADSDWYPWFRARLADIPGRVQMLELPNRDAPMIDECVASLRAALGDDAAALRSTVLIGHSVGCQALLRYLASLTDAHVGPVQLVCVAGWWVVDRPWPTIRPWIETPLELERVRALTDGRVSVVLSDDDPFTADWQANAALWRERLGARIIEAPSGRHFNDPEVPIVLALVRELLGV